MVMTEQYEERVAMRHCSDRLFIAQRSVMTGLERHHVFVVVVGLSLPRSAPFRPFSGFRLLFLP